MKTSTVGILCLLLLPCLLLRGQSRLDTAFASGEFELGATFLLPEGSGPFPLVVLVHGSGPNNRDGDLVIRGQNLECIYPHLKGDTISLYRQLAEGLASEGIASFRYDKRTTLPEAAKNQKEFTPRLFADDAAAAMRFAKRLSGVDTARTFYLGHSQGANLIPLAATRENAAGLISVSGNVSPIDSIIVGQILRMCDICDLKMDCKMVANQNRFAFQTLRSGEWPEGIPLGGAYPKFWLDWIEITGHTVENYEQIGLPVLIVHGTEDFNVEAAEAILFHRELNMKDKSLFLLEGGTHLLTSGTSTSVSSEIITAISRWVRSR